MLLTPEMSKELVGSTATLALLAVAYGIVVRIVPRRVMAQVVLGALFGGAAVLAMLEPIQVAPDVITDLRLASIVLAGAFLGVAGAATAVLVALGAQVGLEGSVSVEGAAGGVLAGLVGLAGASLAQWIPRRRRNAVLFVVLVTIGAAAVLVLPVTTLLPDAARSTLAAARPAKAWPGLVAFLVVGALLQRERRLAAKEDRLSQAAARDLLTGLLNRRGFEARVAPLMRRKRGAALLVLDLDHFKRVNDTLGHATGDAVLRSLAARLSEGLRPQDVIARFGGEEVVVFLPGLDLREAQAAAARLCDLVRAQPFVLPSGRRRTVTASVGGAWTGGRVRLDALMASADAALYAAKEAGRNCWRFDVNGSLTGEAADLVRAALYRVPRAARS